MPRKPTGAAALLAGLAEEQARGLREDADMINDLPKPDSYAALTQRVRLRGVIARSGVALHKLLDQEDDRRDGASDQNEADMDDRPEDPDAIERKYMDLQDLVRRFRDRDDAGADQGEGAGERSGHCPGQLAPPGEQRAA